MLNRVVVSFICCIASLSLHAVHVWVEAESFTEKGGWAIDQQFVEEMGSTYLLAHGMGVPVPDAQTEIEIPEAGTYYIYVRTYNWTSPWKKGTGPGKFQLLVNGRKTAPVLGDTGETWFWQSAGKVKLKAGKVQLQLHDLAGFDGRCDAIYLTTNPEETLPEGGEALMQLRRQMLGLPDEAPLAGTFDLVVCGGGTAGISAAVAAGRLGLRVALINDRPVIGGNNSSEIRVHHTGYINKGPYPKLGDLQKEFVPTRSGNAKPADYYDDQKKLNFVRGEKNVNLFLMKKVVRVEKKEDQIHAVIVQDVESGQELRFESPLFVDCTGDGQVGFLAGADYHMGRENRAEYGESRAPEKADSMTLGSSVMWYSVEDTQNTSFPEFEYGITFNDESCERVTMGEWTWETGMFADKTRDFERVRDYGMLVIYSNWSYLKNKLGDNSKYRNRRLGWVAHIAGKRESRRLLGDYILKQDDITRHTIQEDGTCATCWPIDLHYPDPKNTKFFPQAEFKAINRNTVIYPYPIPYRCFYSRNVSNLFMAGRDISVSHVALGTVRVMRTTGMMGEVVGMAASLCHKYKVLPRAIYQYHLSELKSLMTTGVGRSDAPDNQHYNENEILKERPQIASPKN